MNMREMLRNEERTVGDYSEQKRFSEELRQKRERRNSVSDYIRQQSAEDVIPAGFGIGNLIPFPGKVVRNAE